MSTSSGIRAIGDQVPSSDVSSLGRPLVVKPATTTFLNFQGGSVVKNPPAKQEMQEARGLSLDQEDPLE